MAQARSKLDVYPSTNYTIEASEAVPRTKDYSTAARLDRMRARFETKGTIRSVDAVLLMHAHNHPHVLLLQDVSNSTMRLPGGKVPSRGGGGRRSHTQAVQAPLSTR